MVKQFLQRDDRTTFKQYQVVGRRIPDKNATTEEGRNPTVYRMKIFAKNPVVAKSRFWYFVSKLRKLKKANGEILSVNELKEPSPLVVKNFGIWIRYNSRSGIHNMYKEYRDTKLVGAIEQLYTEMASRHRARFPSIQIIKTAVIPDSQVKRANTLQFTNPSVKFPLPHRVAKVGDKQYKKIFSFSKPLTIGW